MKTILCFVTLCVITANSLVAQTGEKSVTTSSLVSAQEKVFQDLFDTLYNVNDTIDIDERYKKTITEEILRCLKEDINLWGQKVIADAQNGQFKRYKLSFEKTTGNTKFLVPEKAKRNYRKAFDKMKKDFIKNRKKKTLEEIFEKDNLRRYISNTVKSFEEQKEKYFKKISQ